MTCHNRPLCLAKKWRCSCLAHISWCVCHYRFSILILFMHLACAWFKICNLYCLHWTKQVIILVFISFFSCYSLPNYLIESNCVYFPTFITSVKINKTRGEYYKQRKQCTNKDILLRQAWPIAGTEGFIKWVFILLF